MSKKLRMRRIKLILLSLFFLASVVLANNDHGITHFERELFTPQIFNHFGIGKDRFQSLTSDQKNNLLEARKALMLFLVTIQNPDSDFSKFLSQEFLDQYKTRQDKSSYPILSLQKPRFLLAPYQISNFNKTKRLSLSIM